MRQECWRNHVHLFNIASRLLVQRHCDLTTMPPKPPPSDSAAPSKKAPKNPKPEVASIDDLVLPRSLVTRLAKSVLPPNAAIQKQALLALSQGSTVFVNFLCSAANDIARREGRKALSAADILKAINQLEFGDFAPRLEAELALFTRVENGKKSRKERGTKNRRVYTYHEEAEDCVRGASFPFPAGKQR
ncbi:histone-fold-containing protein [Sphaerosporella brunnea]|uniref:DNA polymerase epsilon subunit D n=1 Tax=Sphaerosporella brunnea TaxID=1250544 RepID=A0A5J5F085_9PEZI|nr:histone-fold-containing protein [Sphaerosporella brunnea]